MVWFWCFLSGFRATMWSLPLPVLTSSTWQAKHFSRGSTTLTTGQLAYRFQRVNLINCLVLPQTNDARKAQGKSAFVPV
jgi:hypothetical protein